MISHGIALGCDIITTECPEWLEDTHCAGGTSRFRNFVSEYGRDKLVMHLSEFSDRDVRRSPVLLPSTDNFFSITRVGVVASPVRYKLRVEMMYLDYRTGIGENARAGDIAPLCVLSHHYGTHF